MNILILHGSSDLYGASKILLVTVKLLKKRGHIPVVVLSNNGPLVHELTQAGIEVVFVRLGILRRKYKSLSGMVNRIFVLRKAYPAIKKLITERNTDIVYSNTTAVLAGAFAARSTKTRHIWHVHEIIETPRWLYYFIGKLLGNYCETVIVVSEAVKKSWQQLVPANKIQVIYNGIDYAPYLLPADELRRELNIDNNTIVIGMIGRVHYWKGQDYFLAIAGALSRKFNHLRFVMIGDAFPGYEYLYDQLEGLKKTENIESIVSDLGYRSDVAILLPGFDILVLPSQLADPFPTVILEAMASAKPVVATSQGGALEMIDDGQTGILIPVRNAERAAQLMEKMITDTATRVTMGEAARKKVLNQFSFEAFENKMIKVFE